MIYADDPNVVWMNLINNPVVSFNKLFYCFLSEFRNNSSRLRKIFELADPEKDLSNHTICVDFGFRGNVFMNTFQIINRKL